MLRFGIRHNNTDNATCRSLRHSRPGGVDVGADIEPCLELDAFAGPTARQVDRSICAEPQETAIVPVMTQGNAWPVRQLPLPYGGI